MVSIYIWGVLEGSWGVLVYVYVYIYICIHTSFGWLWGHYLLGFYSICLLGGDCWSVSLGSEGSPDLSVGAL